MPVTDMPTNHKFIINIGKLRKIKDQITFIKTIANLPDDFHGIIIGSGQEKENLQKFIQAHKLYSRIHLLGEKDNVFPYLTKSTFYLSTSKYEGFGIVLLEAMSCGLPIIATNCPHGTKEIIANNTTHKKQTTYSLEKYGILAPISNNFALSQAIIYLDTHPKLLQHYKQQSKKRAKQFDMPIILKQWIDLIDKI